MQIKSTSAYTQLNNEHINVR